LGENLAFLTLAIPASLCLFVVTSCTSNGKPNQFLKALPRIAVSSPTARSISDTQRAQLENSEFTVKAALQSALWLGGKGRKAGPESLENQLTALPEAAEIIRGMASGNAKRSLKGMHFEVNTPAIRCFGQGQRYTNHPDGGPDSSTRGGETGFESEVELVGGIPIACPAVTMNRKVLELGGLVNQALALTFVAAAELHAQGNRLPTMAGETVAATLPKSPSLLDSRVRVTRLPADKSSTKYLWNFSSTLKQGPLEVPVEFWLAHENSGPREQGRLSGAIPQGAAWYTFSLTYELTDGRTRYELRSANAMGPHTTAPKSAFSKDGSVLFGGASDQQSLFYMLADLDSQSGLGNLKASWAASAQSARSQIFEISTYRGTRGMDEGFAYFGYGPTISEKQVASKDAHTAQSMICAWSAGNQSFLHSGTKAERSGWVQAMKLVRNTQTGEFLPEKDSERIGYCPTQSCNGEKNMTYGGAVCDGPHRLARLGQYGRVSIEAPRLR
jgi:hypothetical protein